jgi:hypothetical protein
MRAKTDTWYGVLVIVALWMTAGLAGAQPVATQSAPVGGGGALSRLKTAGREASLTVFPAGVIGRPVRPVGDVVALMLERGGMGNLQVDAPEFEPPEHADLAETARVFGAFVRTHPIETDYALFADFRGSREKGFEEVCAVLATRQGETVWQDRQTVRDADYQRIKPREPMECCLLVVERLRPLLGLEDPGRVGAPEGKIARRWAEQSGVPDQEERGAMQERQRAFQQAAAKATLLVYPAQAGSERSADSAAQLVQLLDEGKRIRASVAEEGPRLDVKGHTNEQKVLWEMARGVREFVRAHRPAADYVLYAHYLMGPDAAGKVTVGAVHFVVCDREGRWVIVDFQNSHHDDFNAVKPQSRADCDRLVVRRLTGYCR